MKFVASFDAFLNEKVNLNQTRIDALEQRSASIETFIKNSETFKPIFLDMIPAGSWAFRTIIKPVQAHDEFDADILLLVEEQETWRPKDYIENLYAAFSANGTYKDIVKRHTRCVRVDYANDFHLDVVPFIEQGGLHYITNRLEPEATGQLEESNPPEFTAWIDRKQAATNNTFVKVVRLLKYLRDYKETFSCKSIILATLLGEQVNEIEASLSPHLYADVPSTLKTVLNNLAAYLPEAMPPIMDPGGTGEDFGERVKDDWNYVNFRTWIQYYAKKVTEAFDSTVQADSIAAWQAVFGQEFDPGALAKSFSIEPHHAAVPAKTEEFIENRFAVALDQRFKVKIEANVIGYWDGQNTISRGFRIYKLANYGNRVAKRRKIRFMAATNVPTPFKMYWKVRNGGGEAATEDKLRGEITEDAGRLRKEEPTAYAGAHYVECYVIKNGVVVARARQNVLIPAS